MSRDQRRRERDPVFLQVIRARLARIKVAQTTKRTNELAASVPPNWIESVVLTPKRKEQ